MIRAEPGCILPVYGRLASLLRRGEMSPLFMDTGSGSNSPGSLSAEENHSNNAGSEREEEGQQMGNGQTKRQEKNRDAARKSRKKQTERADELHEELQCLERSNTALQKEIASLKKELHLYTMTLERHKPFCCLEASASSSSSTTRLSHSPSAVCQTGSSPRGVPPPASSSTLAAAPSPSTSLTPTLDLQTLGCVESTHLPSSTTTTTALAPSPDSSAELFTSSGSITVPYSVSFSTVPPPHSLFSEDPPSLIASRPVCASLVSNPVPSSSLTTAAQHQPRQGTIHESFSPRHPGALDEFLMRQAPFTPSSDVVPPYSGLAAENTGLVGHGCPLNVPQLHPGHFRVNPVDSGPPCSLLPPALRDPALQSLFVSPRANPESPPASAFALKPSYSRHVTPNPAPLLSLLTVPSPLSQTTSSSFDGPLSQPPPSLPPLGDPLRDFSLSELLEGNDWILE